MSKKLMTLTIMSPLSTRVVQAEWIEANTSSGSFVVKPRHAPLITSLASNKILTIGLDDGTQKIINVTDGILEVTRDAATLLLTKE